MIDIFIQRATLFLTHRTKLNADVAYVAAKWHADRWATHCATHGDISPEIFALSIDVDDVMGVSK